MSCPAAVRKDASVSRSDASGDQADARFQRDARLTARKDFLAIYGRGLRVSGAFFVLFAVRGSTVKTRLGITATKKIGNSVERNRVKRRVREIFRRHGAQGGVPLDVVVNVRAGATRVPYERLEDDLVKHFADAAHRLAS